MNLAVRAMCVLTRVCTGKEEINVVCARALKYLNLGDRTHARTRHETRPNNGRRERTHEHLPECLDRMSAHFYFIFEYKKTSPGSSRSRHRAQAKAGASSSKNAGEYMKVLLHESLLL